MMEKFLKFHCDAMPTGCNPAGPVATDRVLTENNQKKSSTSTTNNFDLFNKQQKTKFQTTNLSKLKMNPPSTHESRISEIAEQMQISEWRAHELIVENAASSIGGVHAAAQEPRTYGTDSGQGQWNNRADLHVASSVPGGPSVVIDAKHYSTDLPREEVDKLARDVTASRSSGGIVVMSRDVVSDATRNYARERGIEILVANRNLAANMRATMANMFAASGQTPPALRVTSGNAVDHRSSAVRSGDVLLTNDGSIDRRSAAVQRGDVRVCSDGTPHAMSRAMHPTPSATAAHAAAMLQPSAATPVARNSSAVRSGDVMFTQAGGVDRRSAAVRSGDLRFNGDGSIDRRSAAVRSGDVRVNSSSISSGGKSSGKGSGGGRGGGGKSGKK
jgi:hypothetical protein